MTLGILITNVGTPEAPTDFAVRKYLKKFLSDRHVVQIPRWIWWPILYGIILPFRSSKSAKLYQKIWTDKGSPLLENSKEIVNKLNSKFDNCVVLGMNYGEPSIESAMQQLKEKNITQLIVMPLFPQYSSTTTAVSIDRVLNLLEAWDKKPELKSINSYAAHPKYIDAIASSIQHYWAEYNSPQHLLFSFHGLPSAFEKNKESYAKQCYQTAQMVSERLGLDTVTWSVSFQSRLGYGAWLSPYTDQVLQTLPTKGIKDVHVICPGFAVDCLETLEEIVIRGKEQFLNAGGEIFHYIPALNASASHIQVLESLIQSQLQN